MEQIYPSLLDRIQSVFIDLIFIVVMMFILTAVLDKYENVPDWVRIVLFFGLWAVYEPLLTALGCTLGQFIKGIRVREYENTTERVNIFQAFIRYVVKTILGWISFLTINTNPERRALHDLACGSVMIKI